MAQIRSPLGKIRGRIGNLVFKQYDETNHIAAAPSGYNAPMDPASVSRRSKFSFVAKFSAALLKLSVRLLWRKVSADNRIIVKVFKANYPLISDQLDLAGVYLTEKPDFRVTNPEINITSSYVQVIAAALGTNQKIDTVKATKVAVEGVLCLSSPLDDGAPKVSFVSLASAEQDLVLNDSLTFNISLEGSEGLLCDRYATKKVAVVILTKDANGNPVQSSKTMTN